MPSSARLLAAGRAVVGDVLARLAFWTAVGFPAIYLAVHLRYGFGRLGATALAGLLATNAVAVAVGHRHAADREGDARGPDGDRSAGSVDRTVHDAAAGDARAPGPVGGD